MTKMTPLLERNEQFAQAYTPVALGRPTAQVFIVACLDHRVDPALLSPKVSVSGHVYDVATGRVTTTLDARYPQRAPSDRLRRWGGESAG